VTATRPHKTLSGDGVQRGGRGPPASPYAAPEWRSSTAVRLPRLAGQVGIPSLGQHRVGAGTRRQRSSNRTCTSMCVCVWGGVIRPKRAESRKGGTHGKEENKREFLLLPRLWNRGHPVEMRVTSLKKKAKANS
jgi:hypothetical protein